MTKQDVRFKCERCGNIEIIRDPVQLFCSQPSPPDGLMTPCSGELRKVKILEKEVKVQKVKRFKMIRHGDESGVSGMGHVLDGIIFHNGWVVICWRTDTEEKHGNSCITYWESYEAFYDVHIRSHPTNNTEIQFYDCEVIRTNE